MTLQQFKSLHYTIQEKMLVKNGIFLFERKAIGAKVLLYQISGFYVEVFYDTSNCKVCVIKAFTHTDGLDAYLYKIDISDIESLL